MKARLICYTLGNIDPSIRSSFKRELNGYLDLSNNGKYKYRRTGILQKIPHKSIIRSVLLVRDGDKKKVTMLLDRYKATYHIFSVNINPNLLEN